ncbi:hypothetical protein SAMD00019534_056190 [Acytostelium subglobosum LB1]|uniref:hypothetical protein n=1 Tax=Acytostelium subglobosum LB1 TaxID=1410327 RepID=UPI0006450B71|nr:hypothetical protein SAMD00019534_056190 [Acytostelium subglobosum LB1]GAM22444.1 hypothetical protein SAMD00019534_056190 [Acytostelium subglobosum LB1]|eukprot:XP_012754564.1 hypothetical protein SAMD00019534_056190 [Acytostelium subglobosum LB1]
MVRHDVHLEINDTKGKKLRVKIKKIRPARLRRDKKGRYIRNKKRKVYINSRKSDLELIKKLMAEASNAKPILTPSTAQSHITPTEGSYIRSIQDANYREALMKNARDLEQQTRAKVDAIIKDAAAHSDIMDIKQSLNKRFQQDMEKLEIEAQVEQKRYELEMKKLADHREREQNSAMSKINKLLSERRSISKQEPRDTDKLEHIDGEIDRIRHQMDDGDVKRMLDQAVNEQRLEQAMERAEREKQKTVEHMKAVEVMAAAAAPKQPKPSLLKKPVPSIMSKPVPKVKTEPEPEPEERSPYSSPPHPPATSTTSTTTTTPTNPPTTSTTSTTTTTTTNKRLSIPASSVKALRDVPAALTPKIEPIIQKYIDGDPTMTNPITLYYHLGKELRPAAMDPKEKQDLQRQLKDDAIHAKRVQDMASMRHVLESFAPQVTDLVTRYWNNAITWKDLPTLLKKELKNHKNKDMLVDAILNEAHQIKKGNGKREEGGGLYDYEIEQLMQPFHKDGFDGVIASDQLDELKPKQRMSFIMNLDKSSQPGSHWVACNIDAKGDKSIEYYDSFGDDPSTDFMRRMKQLVREIDPDVYLKLKSTG